MKQKICPHCDNKTSAKYQYCPLCGNALIDAENAGKEALCKRCGQRVDLSFNKHCPQCGLPLTVYNVNYISKKELDEKYSIYRERRPHATITEGSNKSFYVAVCVIMLCLTCGFLAFVKNNADGNVNNTKYNALNNTIYGQQKHTEKPVGKSSAQDDLYHWQITQVFVQSAENSETEKYIKLYVETNKLYELGEVSYTKEGYYTFDVYNAPIETHAEWEVRADALNISLRDYLVSRKVRDFKVSVQGYSTNRIVP